MSEQKSLEDIIKEAEQSLDFGTVTLTFKRTRGLSTTIDMTKITRTKVTGNAQALALIGSMLKMLAANEETGNLTFTVALNKGDASEIMTHDFQRNNLDFNTGEYK